MGSFAGSGLVISLEIMSGVVGCVWGCLISVWCSIRKQFAQRKGIALKEWKEIWDFEQATC